MNFETSLTKIIEKAVRNAVQDELEAIKKEISNCITAKPKTRNVTSDKNKPKSRIIRPKELSNMLSISIPTLYRMKDEGELPPKVMVSSRAVGWLRSDIEEWLISRKQEK